MEENLTGVMSNLVIQIGIIIFAVRVFGKLSKKVGIPSVLGELLAGVIIGPYALGNIVLPGFPEGIFPLNSASLAVSPELYSFSIVASIILLFASGLETDLGLFLRYSVAGGIVGIGGVIFSFGLGDIVGVLILPNATFMDTRCLFLGILSTATSVGITARILSDQKKMDSPEGVTILAAAVFDDVLGIVCLAVVLGLVAAINSGNGSIDAGSIGFIAAKAFGIWLGFTVLGLVFAKKIAKFLKLFKHSFDFSICAIGIALILAGFFEKQGLAMIIGAYITGLSLSGTDIAAVIQERIHGLYEFFVPIFFAVMGMMVNLNELMNKEVIIFGLIYTGIAIFAKIFGCGLPTLMLGFNSKGALRIGCGMIPRGEVALIIAGIGITAGILDEKLFGVVIMMTLLTTIIAPPLLNLTLKISGRGTRKEKSVSSSMSLQWDFGSDEIADLVVDTLLKQLKAEGFYVQMINIDDGLSQARKNDISLSITEQENIVSIETDASSVGFVRNSIYEVILQMGELMQNMTKACDPAELKRDLTDSTGKCDPELFKIINERTISINLKAETKEDVLKEMTLLMTNSGMIQNWEQVLADVMLRETAMNTGMQHGIAIPHAKSSGVIAPCLAIGIKKEGIDFGSIDGQKSRIFVMIVSPKQFSSPHIQYLASIGSILKNEKAISSVMNATSASDLIAIMKNLSK